MFPSERFGPCASRCFLYVFIYAIKKWKKKNCASWTRIFFLSWLDKDGDGVSKPQCLWHTLLRKVILCFFTKGANLGLSVHRVIYGVHIPLMALIASRFVIAKNPFAIFNLDAYVLVVSIWIKYIENYIFKLFVTLTSFYFLVFFYCFDIGVFFFLFQMDCEVIYKRCSCFHIYFSVYFPLCLHWKSAAFNILIHAPWAQILTPPRVFNIFIFVRINETFNLTLPI